MPYVYGKRQFESDLGHPIKRSTMQNEQNDSEHIVILRGLRTMGNNGNDPRHLLYYYRGNFFCPMDLFGGDVAAVKKAVRKFKKENKELVEKDRSSPDYRTLPELFDDALGETSEI